jgi:D-alanyl-D-alanine carboxypeptidase
MNESVDSEIAAIKSVLEALSPLSPKARASVLEYIVKRLDLNLPDIPKRDGPSGGKTTDAGSGQVAQATSINDSVHIEELKNQKKPRSANEMAALVAYYLTNVATEGERKKTVNQKDMETYFKIAGFPLPNQIRVTLPNAKAAGYFDAVGEGEYKLNAVGHNLVVHSMPRGAAAAGKAVRRRKRESKRTLHKK